VLQKFRFILLSQFVATGENTNVRPVPGQLRQPTSEAIIHPADRRLEARLERQHRLIAAKQGEPLGPALSLKTIR